MAEFTFRPLSAERGERSFVADSWVRSYASSAMARLISLHGTLGKMDMSWEATHEYWATWNPLVSTLLDRSRTQVVVDEFGLVAGYICWEPWQNSVAVHYVYTRLQYRKMGLASRLVGELPKGPIVYTHRSRGLARIPDGWQFSLRPIFGLLSHQDEAA